jgi:hypothetical protein
MKTLRVFPVAGALLLAILFVSEAHPTEIRLKSGRTFEGTIKHLTPQTMVVETGNQVLFLSSDLLDMSAKDWLAAAQTAYDQDNIEHATILCKHALKKSKDMPEARELMRQIAAKRMQKEREASIRATEAVTERIKDQATSATAEITPSMPSETPAAPEMPATGATMPTDLSTATLSTLGTATPSTGTTSETLTGAPAAPGSLQAGFRLDGKPQDLTTGTLSSGASDLGGNDTGTSVTGAAAPMLPPGFGMMNALKTMQPLIKARLQAAGAKKAALRRAPAVPGPGAAPNPAGAPGQAPRVRPTPPRPAPQPNPAPAPGETPAP